MHRISPFVVIYAEFLLIAQYLYCMNLTENELPSHVDTRGINLAQIGFIRYRTHPCLPLLLKTLFTSTFWLTLRQMKYEDTLQRQSSTLAHLAAPFHVTVSAATTDLGPKQESKKSKMMLKAGTVFKTVLMQFWIWIVVFALFFFSVYGKDMTVFRIVYMGLFLIFMVTFQVSSKKKNFYLNKSSNEHIYREKKTIGVHVPFQMIDNNKSSTRNDNHNKEKKTITYVCLLHRDKSSRVE